MVQRVGFVSCDIIGHSREKDLRVQIERIGRLNRVVGETIAACGPENIYWASGGDGGHVGFLMPDWAEPAVGLMVRLREWSRETELPLRLSGHCGDVEWVDGAPGRREMVGDGINLAGRLLDYSDHNAVIASAPFADAVLQAGVPGVQFHDPVLVQPKYFPPGKIYLASVEGRFRSAWETPRTTDRRLLEDALRSRQAWEVIYRGKRLLQADAADADALQALGGLGRQGLTYRNPATEELETNEFLGLMDKHARTDFLRAAQLVERDPDDLICQHGDGGDAMFVILRGEIGVLAPGREPESAGELKPVLTMGAGMIVGELAFALHRPRTATLKCLAKTALLAFTFQQLQTLLRESRFRARIETTFGQFLKSRILKYVCDNVSFLVGRDRTGPLAALAEPWELMLDHARVLTCSAAEERILSRQDESFRDDGLYILAGGRLQDAADPTRVLDGNDLPVLYAHFPGKLAVGDASYTAKDESRILHIGTEALQDLGPDLSRRVLEGVRQAVTKPLAPPVRPVEEEAFASQTVLVHYPAPIALAFRRFCQQGDPAGRTDRLFKALEATLKYLVFLGAADLLHCLALGPAARGELPAHAAFEFLRKPTRMTLGKWVSALREVAGALAGRRECFVRELPETCRPGGRFDGDILGWIVAQRNLVEHVEGSVALTSQEYQDVVRRVRPKLEEAFQRLGFLRRYPLGFVTEGVGRNAEAGRRRYCVHSCMGASVASTEEAYVIESAEPFTPGMPFVVAPDGGRLLYLWPLLQQKMVEHTGRHSLFAFETLHDHGAFLTRIRLAAVDLRATWEVELHDRPAAGHAWLLERLRALPAVLTTTGDRRLTEGLQPAERGRLVGRTLGPNRLLAAIACGGFGTIYAAETPDGRRVAVKVLETPEASRQYPRFRQEFEKLRRAGRHPGIVQCFELDNQLMDGREYPWYSMEFAAGGDLRSRMEERQRGRDETAPWAEAAARREIIREFQAITAAVAHLHGLEIIHRDIKPGNVLIMENGELRLSDFGLVKSLDLSEQNQEEGRRTSTGAVLGTPWYMAPEQERGEKAEKPADVYALGVVLAELSAGRRPSPNTRAREGSTLGQCPEVQRLPRDLARLIRRCTDAAADKRPPDALAVQEEFTRVVEARNEEPAE